MNGSVGNHASMLIEGLNDGWFKDKTVSTDDEDYHKYSVLTQEHFQSLQDGEYFLHKIHFTGKTILYEDNTHSDKLYNVRQRMEMFCSMRVKKMINEILPLAFLRGPSGKNH